MRKIGIVNMNIEVVERCGGICLIVRRAVTAANVLVHLGGGGGC